MIGMQREWSGFQVPGPGLTLRVARFVATRRTEIRRAPMSLDVPVRELPHDK